MTEHGLIWSVVMAIVVAGCVAVYRPSAAMRKAQDDLHKQHLEKMKRHEQYHKDAQRRIQDRE